MLKDFGASIKIWRHVDVMIVAYFTLYFIIKGITAFFTLDGWQVVFKLLLDYFPQNFPPPCLMSDVVAYLVELIEELCGGSLNGIWFTHVTVAVWVDDNLDTFLHDMYVNIWTGHYRFTIVVNGAWP